MIIGYVGIPGCGKTSVLTLIAQKELQRIQKGKSKYKEVYTSFYCVGCKKLNFQDLGKFYFHHCLILLDEMTLLQDSRDWKNLSESLKQFIVLHRHFDVDCIYDCQDWSRCEKTFRENTYMLFYLERLRLPFLKIAKAQRIYRNLSINEYSSELTLGYRFAKGLLEKFGTRQYFNLKKAFKYFDSFEKFGFDQLPPPPSVTWKRSAPANGSAGAVQVLTTKK